MSESFSDRPAWVAKPCCEEAALNAAEVNRLTSERDQACAANGELMERVETAESRRSELIEASNEHRLNIMDLTERVKVLTAERDELQAKLDAAKDELAEAKEEVEAEREAVQRIISERDKALAERDDLQKATSELAPAVPSWIGDVPDKPEVTQVSVGVWDVGGHLLSAVWSSEEFRRDGYRRIALANAMEVEEAATRDDEQRIEKQSERLYLSTQGEIAVAWESLTEPMRNGFRAAIDAGWTPPESEDKK